jgi:hypothetical protein
MKYLVIDQTGNIKRSLEFPNFIQILSHSESNGLIVRDDNIILRYNAELKIVHEDTIHLDSLDVVKNIDDKISIFNRKTYNFRIFQINKLVTPFKFSIIQNTYVSPIQQVLRLFPVGDHIFFETKSKSLCGAKLSEAKNQVYCTDMDDYLLSENIFQKDEKTFVSESYNLSLEQKKIVEFEFFQGKIKIINKSKESIGFKSK